MGTANNNNNSNNNSNNKHSIKSNNNNKNKEKKENLKRSQQEAFEILFTKLRIALRQEKLNDALDLYSITLEQWLKEEEEKKRIQEQSSFSANEKKIKASIDVASKTMSSFWKSAKASLKTIEDNINNNNNKSSSEQQKKQI